jgi:Zn-dependent M28 family amino/carboxypeptidase
MRLLRSPLRARRPRRALAATAALVAAVLLSGCLRYDVDHLASDQLGGRDNGTPGSLLAQDHLYANLSRFAVGANQGATGRAAYEQTFAGGTNIIGIIPGTDLADQYVMIGAHYDGHGSASTCGGKTASDQICNGATDNAAGAAIVLNVAQQIAEGPHPPRRSVIVAFWDREEDGLLGSRAYVAAPLVPLAQTVAYVNLDIQGANLRPSVRNTTFAIGAETGGPVLADALADATAPGPLDTSALSLVFGQGRSDHAVLAANSVPVVFFSDATGPCYHTVGDDADVIDHTKLRAQFDTTLRITRDLANRSDRPTFTTGLPLATYDDAVKIQALMHDLVADWPTFSAADQQSLQTHLTTVDGIVAQGPANFPANMVNLLLAAQGVVTIVTHGPCDGFLAPS